MIHHVLGFVREQILKTLERPSRLLLGPLLRLFLALLRLPRLPRSILPILPRRWIDQLGARALYFSVGYELFQCDRPVEAWPWLKQYLAMGRPSTNDYRVGAICLYHGLGRFRDAVDLLAQANQQNFEKAAALHLAALPLRILDSVWARHIGHTATLDYVIKLGVLEGRKREDTILCLPRGSVIANPFLLQQVCTHLRLVDDFVDLRFHASATQALHYDYLGPQLPDQRTSYFWEVAAKTYKRWHDAGYSPLFTLPRGAVERGWAVLQRAGVPRSAWFVALHVREGKLYGRNPGIHGILNADLSSYLPVIMEITRRGGWVIRMGDPDMSLLPPLEGVIDYCHSDVRADWMDVFIAARCRFMVGTSSGPAYVPALYGVPCVLTNWWPPAQRPWHPSDIFIPKMLRRRGDGRLLTLSETLSEPFSYCHSRRFLGDQCGLTVENNDAELIRSAVEEMLERLDGKSTPDGETAELRAKADQIYEKHNAFGMAVLARGFVRQYRDLIS